MFERLKALFMDVDGVLTSGTLSFDSQGQEIKQFHVQDGAALQFLKQSEIRIAWITGRSGPAVTARALELDIPLYAGVSEKKNVYEELIKFFQLKDDQIGYIGDDLADLSVLNRVGYPFAVANACPEVKRKALYITRSTGGNGAVREVVELILKSQKKWEHLLGKYDL